MQSTIGNIRYYTLRVKYCLLMVLLVRPNRDLPNNDKQAFSTDLSMVPSDGANNIILQIILQYAL